MYQNIIIIIVIFLTGSAVGSFLSVVVCRSLKNEKGIFFGKSKCPNCKKNLKSKDLIPLISYIYSKGKCGFCKNIISFEYPLIEITTGILFVLNYMLISWGFPMIDTIGFYDNIIITIYTSIVLTILIAIVYSDLKAKAVHNHLLYSWIIICLPAIFLFDKSNFHLHTYSIMLAMIFFGGQWWISKGKWLGSGDIWFALGMALLLKFPEFLVAIIVAYIIGGSISVILLSTKILGKKSSLPFTPFLAFGTIISFYFSKQIIDFYMSNKFFLME